MTETREKQGRKQTLEDDSQEGEEDAVLTVAEGVPAPPAVRYQLATGSPRHSPTVTPL
jgi:hypothetical protein